MAPEIREFERSHPWMTFDVDRQLVSAPRRLWELMGGVTALAEQLAESPMLPEYAVKLHQVMLVRGALATTAIEGNTLSQEDVERLLARTLKLPPSKQYLATEVENMIEAFNRVMSGVDVGELHRITVDEIKSMNRQVLQGLHLDDGVVPGEISEHGVVVGPYKGAPRRDCDYLLDRLCRWIEYGIPAQADPQGPMQTSILRALLAHLYLAWIHPFGDGNGRTARLVEFAILANGRIPGPVGHLLSNHFNDTRSEYYRQLTHASRSGGDVVPFLLYALQGLFDGLESQLHALRTQTEELLWSALVRLALPGSRETDQRRRRLAEALFVLPNPPRQVDLLTVTPELTRAYAGKTGKTLTRDLNVLAHTAAPMDLEGRPLVLAVGAGRYRANAEVILGLKPGCAPK